MTTETTPDRIAELECELLTKLFQRDARVWADREQSLNKLSTRVPMQSSSVAIKRLAAKLGCPSDIRPVDFLLKLGWLARSEAGDGWVFTRKVCLPRRAEKAKRKSRARRTPATGAEHREQV